ncbi:MAG: DUF397 domain-containing protein [Actinomycetota bacterium]|nr:DUF397 domain-containing protein [Actinomycetota bacterium]
MVEVPQPPAAACWQKSRATTGGECVQVAGTQKHVWVRDSKNPFGPVLWFTRDGWAVFLVGVQHDEFDRSGMPA